MRWRSRNPKPARCGRIKNPGRAARFSLRSERLETVHHQWPRLDSLLVYAKTSPDRGPHGITAFIVSRELARIFRLPKFGQDGNARFTHGGTGLSGL